ncbi:MAG: nitroreductase family deazaflavin-dependent oxidoreductase [Anaerolineales bacterium]|nr:nitroreductase family deazaflavin-dependent oxidoreductase [Anaerolineales bacterium]
MKNIFIKWFMTINAFLIKISNGKIGGKLGTQTILILHTTGRKSGQPRSIPIAYFFHEGKYLIVESNWGKVNHADWYFNLLKQPQARIEVNGRMIKVNASFAEGEEYIRLWEYVTKKHAPYLEYQKMTERKIPIVVFELMTHLTQYNPEGMVGL